MSRFGIRKKLKKLAGVGRGPEIVQHSLTLVLPDGTEQKVTAEEHYTVVMSSQTLPRPINTGCPDGSCGQCRIEVLEGADALSPMKDNERDVIKQYIPDATPQTRLACHARIHGSGARIKVFELFDFESIGG